MRAPGRTPDGQNGVQVPDEVLPPTGTTQGQQASTAQAASSGR